MTADFARWLKELDLDRYLEVFARNDIDFRSVGHLSDEDLRQLGLTLGHRRRLLAAVAALETGGLRRGGSLQFSTLHPCFVPPTRRNLRDVGGNI